MSVLKFPPPFMKDGMKFQCQGSGKCCVSHGEFGHVFMTKSDRVRMAKVLKLKLSEFTQKYCEKSQSGFWRLKEVEGHPECLFLENKKCSVYEGRPTQCRTWPWWPEVMNAREWKSEVESFCPGVNKGRLWTVDEIKTQLQDQIQSENDIFSE